jgi:predicted aspartyl protease
MNKNLTHFIFCASMVLLLMCLPSDLRSEFYKYVDKEGRTFYVDDFSKIPEEYRETVNVYREKYDHLSDQEKSLIKERELEQLRQLELDNERQLNEQLLEALKIEEEEKRKEAEEARQKLQEKMQTRVIVDNNRILVPVTLGNGGVEVETHLLIDTGASHIALHRSIAEQLNIVSLKRGRARVVGGQSIDIEAGQISYFKVGPYNMENALVIIVSHTGEPLNYSGLLGINFLKNIQYTIDYQNQMIRWKMPQTEESKN